MLKFWILHSVYLLNIEYTITIARSLSVLMTSFWWFLYNRGLTYYDLSVKIWTHLSSKVKSVYLWIRFHIFFSNLVIYTIFQLLLVKCLYNFNNSCVDFIIFFCQSRFFFNGRGILKLTSCKFRESVLSISINPASFFRLFFYYQDIFEKSPSVTMISDTIFIYYHYFFRTKNVTNT